MKIAITLVHNKTDSENSAQIEALKTLVKTVEDGPFTNSETGEVWTTFHHEIIGLNIPHEIKIYQVIPYGVTPPANRYAVNSGNIVYFDKGDEDKTGNHPRFFNWGLKRGTDNGADISVYLSDPVAFTSVKARTAIGKLKNDVELIEESWGKIASVKLLKIIGQLKEDRDFSSAVTELKQRMTEKGLKNG